ncbi:MAG: hypothetical protein L3J31_01420 [Bacteroidales bacterium]|nr:hypothetical protein [Bacteroidales bacterium]
MRKNAIITLVFAIVFSFSASAQFGIQRSIRNKYAKEGRDHAKKEADKGKDKAEDAGMEQADKGLDKASDAAQPGIEKAEEGEEKAEEYTLFGISKYNEFVEGYEADVASKDPADYKKYAFETAIVEYAIEGHDKGTKLVYIDMGGYKMAEYITLKKKKKEEKTTAILIGADIISIDYDEKQAVKVHNPMAYYLANPKRDWVETGENLLIKLGFEKTGKETIMDRECDVWKNGKHKLWVWNGLTLKSVDGKDVETATDIKIDADVPQDKFEVPEGFAYEIIGAEDLFPEIDEDEARAALEEDDEISDEMLDKIENMSYSEFKAWARELDPDMNEEEMKQSYLYLRQRAKQRHK